MTDLTSNILVVLAGVGATAIIGAIAFFIKRHIERKDKVPVEHFLDGYERLLRISESSDPPHATVQEFQDADRLVEEIRNRPKMPATESDVEYGDHLTQADMNRIGGAKLTEADAKINVTVSELMSYQDGATAEALDDVMKKWREFRHNYAAFVAEGYRGSSIQSLMYSSTAEDVTEQFHELLKRQLQSEKEL